MQLKPGQAPPPPAEPLPDPVIDPVVPEVDTDSSEFIENVDEREKAFKAQVKWLVTEVTRYVSLVALFLQVCLQAEDMSYLKRPAKQAEVLVLVATPSQKVVSWATPKLEPLFKTEQGRTLLSSILSTSSRMYSVLHFHSFDSTDDPFVAIAPPLPKPAAAATPDTAAAVVAPKAE
jgi:hypothetical protein